nr:hypothetical protein [uncultured Acetatifactor sp.]
MLQAKARKYNKNCHKLAAVICRHFLNTGYGEECADFYALERQKIRCGESFRLLGFPVAEGKGYFRASLVDAIGIPAGSGKPEKIPARKFSPRNFPRNSRQEMQEKLYTFQKNCYNEFVS